MKASISFKSYCIYRKPVEGAGQRCGVRELEKDLGQAPQVWKEMSGPLCRRNHQISDVSTKVVMFTRRAEIQAES